MTGSRVQVRWNTNSVDVSLTSEMAKTPTIGRNGLRAPFQSDSFPHVSQYFISTITHLNWGCSRPLQSLKGTMQQTLRSS